jgi:phosphate starvation-inducible PhoH-like protein
LEQARQGCLAGQASFGILEAPILAPAPEGVVLIPPQARPTSLSMSTPHQRDFTLDPADNERLANLAGPFDGHLRQIELRLGVEIANRGNIFRVTGADADAVARAEKLLRTLYAEAGEEVFDGQSINLRLNATGADKTDGAEAGYAPQEVAIRVKRGTIRGRGPNQQKYLHAIATHDINFGVGPAGTGKTFLAVASAVEALNESRVQRLILVRPAVEAGEKLGFLPGDLSQKVDPYLRPLYDALYEMMGVEKVLKLLEKSVIEIAPLAYMRGRTLNDAYVILDEAQNTTIEQMKMFLTRLGFGSTAVVTGDLTQIDLPKHVKSGLRDAVDVLRDVDGVSFTFFEARDVVRHPLVARIVDAYDRRDTSDAGTGPSA